MKTHRNNTAYPMKCLNVFAMPARKQIHFLINLLTGLIISIGLHAAEHVDAGEWAVNLVSDALNPAGNVRHYQPDGGGFREARGQKPRSLYQH